MLMLFLGIDGVLNDPIFCNKVDNGEVELDDYKLIPELSDKPISLTLLDDVFKIFRHFVTVFELRPKLVVMPSSSEPHDPERVIEATQALLKARECDYADVIYEPNNSLVRFEKAIEWVAEYYLDEPDTQGRAVILDGGYVDKYERLHVVDFLFRGLPILPTIFVTHLNGKGISLNADFDRIFNPGVHEWTTGIC